LRNRSDRLGGEKPADRSLCGTSGRNSIHSGFPVFLDQSRCYYFGILDWYFFSLSVISDFNSSGKVAKEIRRSGGNSGLVGICFTDDFCMDNLPVNFLARDFNSGFGRPMGTGCCKGAA